MSFARKWTLAVLLTIALFLAVPQHHAGAGQIGGACEAASHHCAPLVTDVPCCLSGPCLATLVAEEPVSFPAVSVAHKRPPNARRPYWPPSDIDRPPKV